MTDQLTSFFPGCAQTEAKYHIVETALQNLEQIFAGNTLFTFGKGEISGKLTFQDAVDAAQFLFLTQLYAILGNLLAILTVLARSIGTTSYTTFWRITTVAFQIKLFAFTAA